MPCLIVICMGTRGKRSKKTYDMKMRFEPQTLVRLSLEYAKRDFLTHFALTWHLCKSHSLIRSCRVVCRVFFISNTNIKLLCLLIFFINVDNFSFLSQCSTCTWQNMLYLIDHASLKFIRMYSRYKYLYCSRSTVDHQHFQATVFGSILTTNLKVVDLNPTLNKILFSFRIFACFMFLVIAWLIYIKL